MEAGMEVPEHLLNITHGRPTSLGNKSEQRNVLVVVDAGKKLQLGALQFALDNLVRPGDHLWLLGILHKIRNPMGYNQKADIVLFNGTNDSIIQEEISKKKSAFQRSVNDHLELQELFDLKQVLFDVKICAGPDRKVVTARRAIELRAKWVILDKNLKKDKGFLVDKLDSRMILMIGNKEGRCIKIPVGDGDQKKQNTSVGFDLSLHVEFKDKSAVHFQERGLNHLKSMIARMVGMIARMVRKKGVHVVPLD